MAIQSIEESPLPSAVPHNSPATAGTSGGDIPAIWLNGTDAQMIGHLQRSLSALSLDRAAEADEEEEVLSLGIEKVITIGISGATSSGKTTLAIILAEVFTTGNMVPPLCLGSGSAAPSVGKQNFVIHEDKFFFHKGACEHTSFPSKPSDILFCRASLERDEINEYVISHEKSEKFNISGPDTDHPSAINFWGLLKTVQFMKREVLLPTIEVVEAGAREGFGNSVVVRDTQEQFNKIKETYSTIISQSRQVVANWAKWQSSNNEKNGFEGLIVKQSNVTSSKPFISPKLLFLEGFILYDKLNPNTPIEDSDTEDEETTNKKNFAYGRMGMFTEVERQKEEDDMAHLLLGKLEKKFQKGIDWTDKEIEYIQEHHYLATKRAMKQLMPLMDIKLFLTTSMQAAKARRLQRPEYLDEPLGTRKPGQMWKTEGYFEHVAWKNHILQHTWLIDFKGNALPTAVDGEGEAGVLIREKTDASVEDTVKWAVKSVLLKLTEMEECARKMQSLEEN